MFDEIEGAPSALLCLKAPERRATAVLKIRCCIFKDGGGVRSEYTILKGASEAVSAAFDSSVGQIAIDVDKTREIHPDKVNDALQWLVGLNPRFGTHTEMTSPSSFIKRESSITILTRSSTSPAHQRSNQFHTAQPTSMHIYDD